MNDYTNIRPIIYIDTKKYRVRICSSAIEMLGSPEYVQLLINPDIRAMLVKPCNREDPCSNHLHRKKGRCCELYSLTLISNLSKTLGIDRNSGFAFYGKYIPNRNAVLFDLTAD